MLKESCGKEYAWPPTESIAFTLIVRELPARSSRSNALRGFSLENPCKSI